MSHRLAGTTGCATGKRVPVRRLPNPSTHHDFGLRCLGCIARDPLVPAHLQRQQDRRRREACRSLGQAIALAADVRSDLPKVSLRCYSQDTRRAPGSPPLREERYGRGRPENISGGAIGSGPNFTKGRALNKPYPT